MKSHLKKFGGVEGKLAGARDSIWVDFGGFEGSEELKWAC
jgi:hypothetical protein